MGQDRPAGKGAVTNDETNRETSRDSGHEFTVSGMRHGREFGVCACGRPISAPPDQIRAAIAIHRADARMTASAGVHPVGVADVIEAELAYGLRLRELARRALGAVTAKDAGRTRARLEEAKRARRAS